MAGAVSAIVTILCIVIVILASLVAYMTKCCKSFNFGGRNRVSSGQHVTKSKRGRSIAKRDRSKRSLVSRHRRSGACKRDFQNAGGDYDYTQELNDNKTNYPVVGGKDYDYVTSKVRKPQQKSKTDGDYEKDDAAENDEKAAKRKNRHGSLANSVPHTVKATTSGHVVEYANISKTPITKPGPQQPSQDRNNTTDGKRQHSGHSGHSYKSTTKPGLRQPSHDRKYSTDRKRKHSGHSGHSYKSMTKPNNHQQQQVPMNVMQGGYISHPAIPAQNYNNPSSNYPAGTKQYPNQPRLAYQLPSPGQLIPNSRTGTSFPGGVPGGTEFVQRSDSRSSDVRKQSAGIVSAWLGNLSQEDTPSAHYTPLTLNTLELHHYAYPPVTSPPENQNYDRQCEPPDGQIDGMNNPDTWRQYYDDSAINKVMNDIESFERVQQELQLMPTKLHETTETRRRRAALDAKDGVTPMRQYGNEGMPAFSRPLKTMRDPYQDEKMPQQSKVPQNWQSGYRTEKMPHAPKILPDKHIGPGVPSAPLPCDVGGRNSSQNKLLKSKRNWSNPSIKSGGSMDHGLSHRNSKRSKHLKSRISMDSRASSSQRKERKKDRQKIAEAAKIAAEWLDS